MNKVFLTQTTVSRVALLERYATLHSALINEFTYCEASQESYSELGFDDRSYQCTLHNLARRYVMVAKELESPVSDDRWFELVFRSGITL